MSDNSTVEDDSSSSFEDDPEIMHKPFACNSTKEIILAHELRCMAPFIINKLNLGMFKLDIQTETYRSWIKYPTEFAPDLLKLCLDSKNNVLHFFEGSQHENKLLNIMQYKINDNEWCNISNIKLTKNGNLLPNDRQIHLQHSSLCPYFIDPQKQTINNNNNNNNSTHIPRDLRFIAVEEDWWTQKIESGEPHELKSQYSINAYHCPYIDLTITNPQITRINNDINKFRYSQESPHYPWNYPWNYRSTITQNREETKIFQITPFEIYRICRVNGLRTKICDVIPDYKTGKRYDYCNGAHAIGGDILIMINGAHKIGDKFIDIFYNISNSTRIKTERSLLGAPTNQDLETLIIEDLEEEEMIVTCWVRKNEPEHFPKYLVKLIDSFYANQFLLMFLKENLSMGTILFAMTSIDTILNPEKAQKINKIWQENRDSAIHEAKFIEQ